MEQIQYITNLIQRMIETRNPKMSDTEKEYLNKLAMYYINSNSINSNTDYNIIYNLLFLCNLVYNNAVNESSPLNDDIYDRLIVLCKNHNLEIPVGAPQINFYPNNFLEIDEKYNGENKVIDRVEDYYNRIYFKPMVTNSTPYMKEDFIINHDNTIISRKMRTEAHEYDLCGTLDKCKYVLNFDAQQDGVWMDGTTSIFERDFLAKHIQEGIIDPNYIELLLTLKYDGVSVENKVQGYKIISSLTRGDMNSNSAADLTPIFGGMEFPRAKEINLNISVPFGIKFEYIITKENFVRLQTDFNKKYVNQRNAVIGVMGGLDARLYRDYLTPVPLETSLNMNRLDEVKFLNKYYTKGIDLRYAVVKGRYDEVLYLVSQYVNEAESLRDYMPFMYDGVVVEYLNPNVRQYLGKRNSIPRYAVAIKFNPMKKVSTFTHYTYSVGQDGVIVPMAHFEPVEFMGAIHDKTTIHSYERFMQLHLKPGDKVTLTLVNDVIVYLRRAPDAYQDKNNNNEIIDFPTNCPACNTPLRLSESNSSAYCPNFYCPERAIGRLANGMKKLNIKNFSSETIRTLNVLTFKDLMMCSEELIRDILGDIRGQNLIDCLDYIRNVQLPDYIWLGVLGFTGIAEKTWKLIMQNITFIDILNLSMDLTEKLSHVKGIGVKTIETINKERQYFINDLKYIYGSLHVIDSYEDVNVQKPKVRFSGIRDEILANKFKNAGYDVDLDGGVTKDILILIVPYLGWNSSKVIKVFDLISKQYSARYNMPNFKIGWDNIHLANGLYPMIMTVDQADQWISSQQK